MGMFKLSAAIAYVKSRVTRAKKPVATAGVMVVTLAQEALTPGAIQQQQLNDLIRQPLIIRPADSSRRRDPMAGLDPEGSDAGVARIISAAQASGATASTISVAGVVIPPGPLADDYPLVTLLPSDNLWSIEAEQSVMNRDVSFEERNNI
jgi:DNA-binding transcriptional LysR family regulator